MNFDFSDDMKLLREEARRFLAERSSSKQVRLVLDGKTDFDRALWQSMAELGWLGIAVPTDFGGSDLGYEALCILAEEVGRACASVPFSSSVYLATEALVLAGTPEQKRAWLPKLVSGKAIATFALAEGAGNPSARKIKCVERDGRLSGTKWPVADGAMADFAVVVAQSADGTPSLYLVDLTASGVTRAPLQTLDPARPHFKLTFDSVPAERLSLDGRGWDNIVKFIERAAIVMAFEQLGGADACLASATAYAKERYAFGRPIGSFQAIKHKLADMYVGNELARSNAYWGAWALTKNAAELPLAAASARVSATQAYDFAAKESLQTHGGMGMTWETDCHLFVRRSTILSGALGTTSFWKDRIVTSLEMRNAP
ncbi:MAG: acyl-CoA/acyl-ACP dehydrogenase [Hyphomicrobiaceae bacterium]|nr:acyl-CoA/acyl-ACP dehydrogenase [Hyphomicrobiaceae bacterium]